MSEWSRKHRSTSGFGGTHGLKSRLGLMDIHIFFQSKRVRGVRYSYYTTHIGSHKSRLEWHDQFDLWWPWKVRSRSSAGKTGFLCEITTCKVLFFSDFSIVKWHWRKNKNVGPPKKSWNDATEVLLKLILRCAHFIDNDKLENINPFNNN